MTYLAERGGGYGNGFAIDSQAIIIMGCRDLDLSRLLAGTFFGLLW